jgi:hypothetical protein
MGLERMPLGGYIKKSQSTLAYEALWQEILSRVTNKRITENKNMP